MVVTNGDDGKYCRGSSSRPYHHYFMLVNRKQPTPEFTVSNKPLQMITSFIISDLAFYIQLSVFFDEMWTSCTVKRANDQIILCNEKDLCQSEDLDW